MLDIGYNLFLSHFLSGGFKNFVLILRHVFALTDRILNTFGMVVRGYPKPPLHFIFNTKGIQWADIDATVVPTESQNHF